MRSIKNKIKDCKGVALVLAMVLVLCVTIISSVVISAANTAAKDIEYNREEQQAYLTVSDAARYFSHHVDLCRATEEWKTTSGSAIYDKKTTFDGNSVFQPLMESIVDAYNNNGSTYSAIFTISPESDEFETKLEDVRVTVSSDSKCDLVSTFELLGDDRTTVKYRMTVYSECNISETCYTTSVFDSDDPPNETIIYNYKKVWTWTEGSIERGFGTSYND